MESSHHHLPLPAHTQNSSTPIRLDSDIGHVSAPQHLAQVAKLDVGPVEAVDGETLVMREGIDARADAAGAVDRRAMVERLDDGLVFIGDARVADVDEPIGGP
jgi:hypothetical protein